MKQLANILFIDIETASVAATYQELSAGMQEQWAKKAQAFSNRNGADISPNDLYKEKAAIFAEFGRVVCVGIGCYVTEGSTTKFVMKVITDMDEKQLLQKFLESLHRFCEQHKQVHFCGHNIKEFDLPYLCRRLLIHGMKLPPLLNLSGVKPWDNPHIDTLELWRFGDYKHYISLALLSEILGIPSPKDDIDGSQVSAVFWEEKDIRRIGTYCLKDVYTTAQVFLKLKNIPPINAQAEYIE